LSCDAVADDAEEKVVKASRLAECKAEPRVVRPMRVESVDRGSPALDQSDPLRPMVAKGVASESRVASEVFQ
jgi:hypothetical protein